MRSNSHYFNTYCRAFNLFAVLICCIFHVACGYKQPKQDLTPGEREHRSEFLVNINTATIEELEKLPNVGQKLGAKIAAHRERHGPFRRLEHLLLVDGISEERFVQLRDLVKIE